MSVLYSCSRAAHGYNERPDPSTTVLNVPSTTTSSLPLRWVSGSIATNAPYPCAPRYLVRKSTSPHQRVCSHDLEDGTYVSSFPIPRLILLLVWLLERCLFRLSILSSLLPLLALRIYHKNSQLHDVLNYQQKRPVAPTVILPYPLNTQIPTLGPSTSHDKVLR